MRSSRSHHHKCIWWHRITSWNSIDDLRASKESLGFFIRTTKTNNFRVCRDWLNHETSANYIHYELDMISYIPDSFRRTGHPDKKQQSDRSEHQQIDKQHSQFHNWFWLIGFYLPVAIKVNMKIKIKQR